MFKWKNLIKNLHMTSRMDKQGSAELISHELGKSTHTETKKKTDEIRVEMFPLPRSLVPVQ